MTTSTAAQAAAPKTVVTRFLEAIGAGDLETLTNSLSPEASWVYPSKDLPISGTWQGRDTILGDLLATAGDLFAPGTGLTITVTSVVAEGETVVAEWTATGTSAGGRPYENRGAGVCTVRDGLITEIREYSDTHHMGRTLFGL
ncbi:nuclear transport factor 2 family protein [Streptomyces sp. VRA16 Mangrove soil]|uniref:nuclear transport factor 2 family protein n=1 Tax=Streptomyces sp. VRA16 Mangrove soil TaxID=2817434 RepID=UPI001A9CDBA4|nr:nuclear transport factor 2 family protein [Streptomyces sp. VRA16 Mangrove soil]MBO1337432.1 nuclear transport factor 2 family protein [Streptomyces sp. VRA16 Mangrove soil]